MDILVIAYYNPAPSFTVDIIVGIFCDNSDCISTKAKTEIKLRFEELFNVFGCMVFCT
jgi:hypothetical protein